MSKTKLVSVQVRNGNIQKALKIFKRRVEDSGHLYEVRIRQAYIKPTTKKRKQKQEAVREQQKLALLEKIENGDKTIRIFTKKRKKGMRN
jgi:small subunit ribosomal protein S21